MKSQSEKFNLYSTSDLGIATFLFTIDHKLHGTSLCGPRKLVFSFIKKADTENSIAEYLSGTGKAPAKRLFDNYRALRALAYEKTGNLKPT